jgi:hypothetical protein
MFTDSDQDRQHYKLLTPGIVAIALLCILLGTYLLPGNRSLSPAIGDDRPAAVEDSANILIAATEYALQGKDRLELPYPEEDLETGSLPQFLSRDWLSEIDENLYTLQVLGSHSRGQIDKFLAGLAGPGEYAWFETRFRQQKWYVVVKGVYPDRQSAINAVLKTEEVTGQKSWARSFGNIKQGIAAKYSK